MLMTHGPKFKAGLSRRHALSHLVSKCCIWDFRKELILEAL